MTKQGHNEQALIEKVMNFCEGVFASLDRHWIDETQGMLRPGYSTNEQEAVDMVTAKAKAMGLSAYDDLAGNRYLVWHGADEKKPAVITGSHLDAVPRGGRFDGPAGVVAGLGAIRLLQEQNRRPDHDIVITLWRCEESPAFNQFAVGSHLATASLPASFLDRNRAESEDTLRGAMAALDLHPDRLEAMLKDKSMLLPVESIAHGIELHIEQGRKLTGQGADIGIVTAIRGNVRFPDSIRIIGEGGHTGGVAQEDRIDAVAIAAEYIIGLKNEFNTMIQHGADLVYAFPAIEVPGASATSIPALCLLRPEVRSADVEILKKSRDMFLSVAQQVAQANKTAIEIDPGKIVLAPPAKMADDVQDKIESKARECGVRAMKLVSGAGHDAGILARAGIDMGMIFLPHGNNGASHRPDEIMAPSAGDHAFSTTGAFAKAVGVLAETLINPVDRVCGRSFACGLIDRGARPA